MLPFCSACYVEHGKTVVVDHDCAFCEKDLCSACLEDHACAGDKFTDEHAVALNHPTQPGMIRARVTGMWIEDRGWREHKSKEKST